MWDQYRPYVNVAERRRLAASAMARRRKKGLEVDPVIIAGKHIATSFWGRAWCAHLEAIGDLENRLPRGRTYVRNGAVCHLEIAPGKVQSLVMGTELYEVELSVKRLPAARWRQLKRECAGGVSSVLELLEGRLSEAVMRVITHPAQGMFTSVREIRADCSCPDWAGVCKHVAAAFYGVGARLDERPDLLFLLRGVDHEELIEAGAGALTRVTGKGNGRRLSTAGLADVFGIDLTEGDLEADTPPRGTPRRVAGARRGRSAAPARRTATPVQKPSRRSSGTKTKAPSSTTQRVKTMSRSTSSPGAARTRGTANSRTDATPVTGASVKRLRRELDLTRAELARLLGVSPASVARWESIRGKLGLHARSAAALVRASRMSRAGAKRALRRS